MEPCFIADVHLGRLARALRMLGFDTAYENSFTHLQLLHMAADENRILLSRNPAFVKREQIKSLLIRSEEYRAQLQQVVNHFGLLDRMQPFSRCMACNGLLVSVEKNLVQSSMEPNTLRYFQEFWQCPSCRRIYWKGAHYDDMLLLIEAIKNSVF